MKCTLRRALHKIMGEDKSYLHYYNSMIKAYEGGYWKFDIRILVKKMDFDVPCSYILSRRGYHKQYCLTVLDFEEFEKQVKKYLRDHIYPMQYVRSHKIICRKAWVARRGFISKGTQYCSDAMYDCSRCLEQSACDIAKKHTKNCPEMVKATKMLELLYGNIQSGFYANQIKEY